MPDNEFPKLRPHPFKARRERDDAASPDDAAPQVTPYAELAVTSNFTFLTGASHPEEMVEQACELGHSAAAITDVNTLAGVVRAHVAAKDAKIPLAIGSRLRLTEPAIDVLVFAHSREGYAGLCTLLTLGKRRAPKGECYLSLEDVLKYEHGLLAVLMPPASPDAMDDAYTRGLASLRDAFDDDRFSLAIRRMYTSLDAKELHAVRDLAKRTRVPLVAVNDVHQHVSERRPLQDVLTCIRHGCSVQQAGRRLWANAERHLKTGTEMHRLFADVPGAVRRSVEIAQRAAAFSMDQLRYEYPDEVVPAGMTAREYLALLVAQGAAARYLQGVPERVQSAIDNELALIAELKYEAYFLTCHDIVRFARSRGILCQGRGGAANSAVCFCLGVTEVDPAHFKLLFARFISRERGEPPDIDIDFEHERREEVIQYLYAKYGRDRAALTAEVISYRGRSALRDVGKAMGLSLDCVDTLAKHVDHYAGRANEERVREAGLNPDEPTIRRVMELSTSLIGFPRHLSQHVGGFVITRRPLSELVPIENAAMEDRTVIEWDKDDIDAMGMLKVDVLGLGMLTCVRKAIEMVEEREKRRSDGATKGKEKTKAGDKEAERREAGEREREREQEARQSDAGTSTPEIPHGTRADLSRSDCMAEEHDACTHDLSNNDGDASRRTIRPREPDEAISGIDSIEYRRGTRTPEPRGLSETPEDCQRLIGGTGHPVRVGDIAEHALTRSNASGPASGDGSRTAGLDPQSGEQIQGLVTPPSPLHHSVAPSLPCSPSSLRRSVASSLSLSCPTISRSLVTRFPPMRTADDPAVYAMIQKADTIGVFQIESRAQMSMLPRLKPATFYDLVIEVAIVRPGPIQGKMVHPYLRRRQGLEPVTYPSPDVEDVLGRTLGVPLFQEQAMQLAIVAAGFTPDEADRLRRAMAAWKRKGDQIYRFGQRIIEGMLARGYSVEFAERCFEQIKGFSEYGFPESHAASFALLVYASCWLKWHHPAAFACALINSQPMGFYQPSQIVTDAKNHGVEVREVDVHHSQWDCTLEERPHSRDQKPALRLGMRLVKGLAQVDAHKIAQTIAARKRVTSIESLWRLSGCSAASLTRLAEGDAFRSMGLDRQAALWKVKPLRDEVLPLFDGLSFDGQSFDNQSVDGQQPGAGTIARDTVEEDVTLPAVRPGRQVLHDYASIGLSLKAHPMSFLRNRLSMRGLVCNSDLRDARRCPPGSTVTIGGIVLVRQRPATASGVVFISLEDETGIANLVLWSTTFEQYRSVARLSGVLLAQGRVERQGDVIHVHVQHLESLDEEVPLLDSMSRDFH